MKDQVQQKLKFQVLADNRLLQMNNLVKNANELKHQNQELQSSVRKILLKKSQNGDKQVVVHDEVSPVVQRMLVEFSENYK